MDKRPRGERILVMESDMNFADQVVNGLKREGYAVTLVRTGPEAFKSIYDVLPHLIIMDSVLSGGDSYDVLAQKQADQMIAKIPIFMISTQAEPINMHRVPEGSISEYFLSLQIDPSKLIEKVNQHFGHTSISESTSSEAVKRKILWIEDDRLIGSILSKKILAAGFDLFHAKNGEEAIEMLKSIVPNVIVVDLVLPNISGFDVIAEIKKDSRVNAIPVMILSNLSKQSDIDRAQTLGVKKYVVKASASLDKIIEEIRQLCH